MPLDRARFGVVHQEARRWGSGRRPSPQTEGKTQQVTGKIQNAVGGFKDAVKKAVND